MHYDNLPHNWAISLTTERTHNNAYGGAFYFAEYGVRVAGAPNTIVAWLQKQYHGTSLQDLNPKDPSPQFSQRGLAIVTSSRLLNTYMAWKENKISATEARNRIAKNKLKSGGVAGVDHDSDDDLDDDGLDGLDSDDDTDTDTDDGSDDDTDTDVNY